MRLLPYLEVLRPWNVLALLAATVAGARLSGATGHALLLAAPALTAAFGYARNDAVDAAADVRNHPARPVPGGRLARFSALAVGWVFLAAAAAIVLRSAPDDPRYPVTFAVSAGLLYFYSPWIKDGGVLGPATVAMLAAAAVLWGGWLGPEPGRAEAAAGLAATVTFARECAKDLEDLPGDRAAGRSTWPLRAGTAPVRQGVRVAALLGLVALAMPWIRGDVGPAYGVPALLVVAPLLLWAALRPPSAPEEGRATSRRLKAALLAGVLALWLGTVA